MQIYRDYQSHRVMKLALFLFVQYLSDNRIGWVFSKVKNLTKVGGLVYFNVFVEKPFLD